MRVTINFDNDFYTIDPCDENDLNELMKLKQAQKSKRKGSKDPIQNCQLKNLLRQTNLVIQHSYLMEELGL